MRDGRWLTTEGYVDEAISDSPVVTTAHYYKHCPHHSPGGRRCWLTATASWPGSAPSRGPPEGARTCRGHAPRRLGGEGEGGDIRYMIYDMDML